MDHAPTRIRDDLLRWYAAHARNLPWRRTREPYPIWVSEVMLQQTRVQTVVPYYLAWLERFPTLSALAQASQDDVLQAWTGLGYYSRARNLHRAARQVMETHQGRVPSDPSDLRSLPGVGEYTAGAIASMAFGRSEPAVDGNTKRVLSRLHDLPSASARTYRDLAKTLIDPDRPGDSNQALIELGALICTPTSPACHRCPVGEYCLALGRDTVAMRPAKKKRKRFPHKHFGLGVLARADGKVRVRRRPEHGLLGGMLEFPNREIAGPAESEAGASSEMAPYQIEGGVMEAPLNLGAVDHVFSHFRASYHVYLFRSNQPMTSREENDAARWVDPNRIEGVALSVAHQRVARMAAAALDVESA